MDHTTFDFFNPDSFYAGVNYAEGNSTQLLLLRPLMSPRQSSRVQAQRLRRLRESQETPTSVTCTQVSSRVSVESDLSPRIVAQRRRRLRERVSSQATVDPSHSPQTSEHSSTQATIGAHSADGVASVSVEHTSPSEPSLSPRVLAQRQRRQRERTYGNVIPNDQTEVAEQARRRSRVRMLLFLFILF